MFRGYRRHQTWSASRRILTICPSVKRVIAFPGARDAGKMRAEGKDYVVKDSDVLNFLFKV